jgi:hypothetical protein
VFARRTLDGVKSATWPASKVDVVASHRTGGPRMNSVPDQQTGGHEQEFDLVNVCQMSLAEIFSSSDSVLANAVRRVVDEVSSSKDIHAAFGNIP